MLEHSALVNLLAGRGDPLWICSFPERARVALGCSSGAVYLSRKSAGHILKDHPDIDTYQLLLLPIAIEKGVLMRESKQPNFVAAMYEVDRKTYFVSMKTTAKGNEVWVSSMYRLRPRQIAKKKRTHTLL